jgi:hypothetical protein
MKFTRTTCRECGTDIAPGMFRCDRCAPLERVPEPEVPDAGCGLSVQIGIFPLPPHPDIHRWAEVDWDALGEEGSERPRCPKCNSPVIWDAPEGEGLLHCYRCDHEWPLMPE